MREFLNVLRELNDTRFTFMFWYSGSYVVFRISWVDPFKNIRISSMHRVSPDLMETAQTPILIAVLKDLINKVKLQITEFELGLKG